MTIWTPVPGWARTEISDRRVRVDGVELPQARLGDQQVVRLQGVMVAVDVLRAAVLAESEKAEAALRAKVRDELAAEVREQVAAEVRKELEAQVRKELEAAAEAAAAEAEAVSTKKSTKKGS